MGLARHSKPEAKKPVLVIEDSESDVALLQRQLRLNGVTHPIVVLGTGDEAIQYLSGSGEYADRQQYPLPFVLLLDLKLPGNTDGLTVLRWARLQPSLTNLLIIVISELEDPSVIREAYRLGANSYLMKPANGEEVRNLLRGFSRYWAVQDDDQPGTRQTAATG